MSIDIEKIRTLRLKKGWSYAQAAQAADLKNRSYWCDVEAGRRDNIEVKTLERMATALGVKAKTLLK